MPFISEQSKCAFLSLYSISVGWLRD